MNKTFYPLKGLFWNFYPLKVLVCRINRQQPRQRCQKSTNRYMPPKWHTDSSNHTSIKTGNFLVSNSYLFTNNRRWISLRVQSDCHLLHFRLERVAVAQREKREWRATVIQALTCSVSNRGYIVYLRGADVGI